MIKSKFPGPTSEPPKISYSYPEAPPCVSHHQNNRPAGFPAADIFILFITLSFYAGKYNAATATGFRFRMNANDNDVNDEVLGGAVMRIMERHDTVSAPLVIEELRLMAAEEMDEKRRRACLWMASWVTLSTRAAGPSKPT